MDGWMDGWTDGRTDGSMWVKIPPQAIACVSLGGYSQKDHWTDKEVFHNYCSVASCLIDSSH